MAGDVGLARAALVDQLGDVARELRQRVRRPPARLGGQVVAAQVGRDDAEPGLGQRRDLVPPAVPELREAVQEHDQRAFALLDVVQADGSELGVALTHGRYFDGMTLAGDADRSRAIVTLRDATVEGRLTLDEFADRVERAELARTDTELAEVVADLPSAGVADLPVKHGAWFSRLHPRRPLGAVAAVQGASRSAARSTSTSAARPCTAPRPSCTSATSSAPSTILVPRGVHVSVDGGGAFSTRDIDLPDTGPVGDAPRLRIITSGMGGTLRVKTSRERLDPGE